MILTFVILLLPSICSGFKITFHDIYSDHPIEKAQAELKRILEEFVKPVEIISFDQGKLVWSSDNLNNCSQYSEFINQLRDGSQYTRKFKMLKGENFTEPKEIESSETCYSKRDSTFDTSPKEVVEEEKKEWQSEKDDEQQFQDMLDHLVINEKDEAEVNMTQLLEEQTKEAKQLKEKLDKVIEDNGRLVKKIEEMTNAAKAAEQGLAEIESKLSEAENRAANAESRRGETEMNLARSEAQLADAQHKVVELELKLTNFEAPIRARNEKRQFLDQQPPPAGLREEPSYGKYIGLAIGFLIIVAYLVCARSYTRHGMYELHTN